MSRQTAMLASLQGLQDQLRGGGTSFFNADAAGRFQQVQQALTIPLPARVSDRGFPAFQEQDSLFGGAQVQVDPTRPRILQWCPGAQSYFRGKPCSTEQILHCSPAPQVPKECALCILVTSRAQVHVCATRYRGACSVKLQF